MQAECGSCIRFFLCFPFIIQVVFKSNQKLSNRDGKYFWYFLFVCKYFRIKENKILSIEIFNCFEIIL